MGGKGSPLGAVMINFGEIVIHVIANIVVVIRVVINVGENLFGALFRGLCELRRER